ncbi:CMP-N-acetylneuraminate-beta-1,4-galactoside alpha-2,3-sialyltransferase-like, partial [Notothenia coriiceps]|uniref:CMP-N-acetylneuraminate-beta-1,4-galactoside alpha-2,3-sialyltransferase-like n=1 Tax=Notothenia coriiceps TaxID=8208 RepID=A0A6I9NF35_9TELE
CIYTHPYGCTTDIALKNTSSSFSLALTRFFYINRFNKLAPMFIDPNYKRFYKIGDYPPPFGVRSQENLIDILLSATQNYGLGEDLDSLDCKTLSTDGFWKSVAKSVPREASDMRILNPYFIQEASFKLIGLPHNHGQMGRGNIPTLGTVAITMALHNCDEVAVAGFGYNMSTPHAPLHYYEKIRMSAIKESWTHNISKEKEFLLKLVKAGVIQDRTNGICGAGC